MDWKELIVLLVFVFLVLMFPYLMEMKDKIFKLRKENKKNKGEGVKFLNQRILNQSINPYIPPHICENDKHSWCISSTMTCGGFAIECELEPKEEKMNITVTVYDDKMSKDCGIEMTDSFEFKSLFEMIRFFQGPGSNLEVIEITAEVGKDEI